MNVYDMDIYVYRYKHLTSINRKNNCEETQSEHVHFEKYVTCPMHTMHSLHMYTYIWIDTNTYIYIYINEYIYIYIYTATNIFFRHMFICLHTSGWTNSVRWRDPRGYRTWVMMCRCPRRQTKTVGWWVWRILVGLVDGLMGWWKKSHFLKNMDAPV